MAIEAEEVTRTYELLALAEEMIGAERKGSARLEFHRDVAKSYLEDMDQGATNRVPQYIQSAIAENERLLEQSSTLSVGSTAVKATKEDIGF